MQLIRSTPAVWGHIYESKKCLLIDVNSDRIQIIWMLHFVWNKCFCARIKVLEREVKVCWFLRIYLSTWNKSKSYHTKGLCKGWFKQSSQQNKEICTEVYEYLCSKSIIPLSDLTSLYRSLWMLYVLNVSYVWLTYHSRL